MEYVEVGRFIDFDKETDLSPCGIKCNEVIKKGAINESELADIKIRKWGGEYKEIANTNNGSAKVELRNDGVYLLMDKAIYEGSYAKFSGPYISKKHKMRIKDEKQIGYAFTVQEECYNAETNTRTISKMKLTEIYP